MERERDVVWLPLRFRDVDAFGHVYHAEFLTLLDEARTRWFRDAMGMDRPSDYVLARVEIDYVSSIVLADESVSATFEVERVGTSSLTLGETMRARDGRVVSRGRAVMVLRDVATGTSRRLTDAERHRAVSLTRSDPA
ncbi:MAG TPA: thioesterase family protein [Nocardioidaceae bacterium]|nr:thioesterase family protein [Nocardioidaceae bacterium]